MKKFKRLSVYIDTIGLVYEQLNNEVKRQTHQIKSYLK